MVLETPPLPETHREPASASHRSRWSHTHHAGLSYNSFSVREIASDIRGWQRMTAARRYGVLRLPEAWIAPPAVRELRELVRYRAKLVALRSGLKAQVHAERRQRRPTSWSPAQSRPRSNRR